MFTSLNSAKEAEVNIKPDTVFGGGGVISSYCP